MIFVPLFFKDKIRIINPNARIAMVTLWSEIDYILRIVEEKGIDLNPKTSKIAVIGNLYGNGLPEMLRNLRYNPQIKKLIIVGCDRSGSACELIGFFEKGLEEVDFLGARKYRIVATNRYIDDLIKPDDFCGKIKIVSANLDNKPFVDFEILTEGLEEDIDQSEVLERKKIDLPVLNKDITFPANTLNFSVVNDDVLEAWKELVKLVYRFGKKTSLKKGERYEILNARVIVTKPDFIDKKSLKEIGFSLEEFERYYVDFLNSEKPEDVRYTYGNRIREYFKVDTIEACIKKLNNDCESRHCYVSLWDTARDIDKNGNHPCFVSYFFRKHGDKLSLTVTVRTHNLMNGWLKNFYGFLKMMHVVSQAVGLGIGPISIISHSLTISPDQLEKARDISNGFAKKNAYYDPNGDIVIDVDREKNMIVLRLYSENNLIFSAQARTARRIQEIIRNNYLISDIDHAIYIGRMIEKAEKALKDVKEFKQK